MAAVCSRNDAISNTLQYTFAMLVKTLIFTDIDLVISNNYGKQPMMNAIGDIDCTVIYCVIIASWGIQMSCLRYF